MVLSGASGGAKYAEQMADWRSDLSAALVDRYGFKPEFVKMFVDETAKTGEQGTAENVRVFRELKQTSAKDDLLLIILLGHGTADGDTAKFNLVGPDLTATEWTICSRHPGPPRRGQHDRGEFSVPREAVREEPHRDHRH